MYIPAVHFSIIYRHGSAWWSLYELNGCLATAVDTFIAFVLQQFLVTWQKN
jgi:hypothetical protein